MKNLIMENKTIILIIVSIIILLTLLNISNTNKVTILASNPEYFSVEIADRGYSNTYNGPGGQIITIDISGNSSNSDNNTPTENNNNNNSHTETSTPPNNTQNNSSNQNNNSENNPNTNSGVSFGSSTSSSTSTEVPNTTPTENTNPDIPSGIISNEPTSNTEPSKPLDFSINNVTVKVQSDNDINENLTLKSNKLLLNFSLQKQIGGDNDYFELYFVKGINEKVELPEKTFNLTVKINPEREFLGFYEVVEDSSFKTLNYNKIDDDTLQFETATLGKYVISYKEQELTDDIQDNSTITETAPVFKTDNNSNNNMWLVIGIIACAIVLFVIVAIIVFKKFVL